MKKITLITLSFILVFSSCIGKTNKGDGTTGEDASQQTIGKGINALVDDTVESVELRGKLYYLRKGNLYILDLKTNKEKELKLSTKPIVEVNISPDGKYIAYEEELYNSDCNRVTSLAFYDLSTESKIGKIEGKIDRKSVNMSRWDVPVAVVYEIVDLENENNTKYYRWTMRTDQKEEITFDEYYDDKSGPEYLGDGQSKLDCPFDVNWTMMDSDEKIYLINNKSGNKTDVVKADVFKDNRLLRFQLSEWIDASHFTYVTELLPEAQCGPIKYSIYIYDLETKTSKLILEDVGPFNIVRNIE